MLKTRKLRHGAIAATFVLVAMAGGSAIANFTAPLYGTKGETPFTPARAGQLTVETNLPSPGRWNGDTPESIKDGYEYCMVANIAHRAGADLRRSQRGAHPRLPEEHHRGGAVVAEPVRQAA
jgi:polar amino acid transport system substrate-binding protein